ncbi:MAG: hypothetical protein AB1486_05060 [Planctomycetota bacterium]
MRCYGLTPFLSRRWVSWLAAVVLLLTVAAGIEATRLLNSAGGNELLDRAWHEAQARIRQAPPDYTFDCRKAVSGRVSGIKGAGRALLIDHWSLFARIYGQCLTLESFTRSGPPIEASSAFAGADSLEPRRGRAFRVEASSYGRKIVVLREDPVAEPHAPRFCESSSFLHEGLGDPDLSLRAEETPLHPCRLLDSAGEPLPNVPLLVVSRHFATTGPTSTDADGTAWLPADILLVGVEDGSGAVTWQKVDSPGGTISPAHDLRLLTGVGEIRDVQARVVFEDGTVVPTRVLAPEASGGLVIASVPAHTKELHIAMLDVEGQAWTAVVGEADLVQAHVEVASSPAILIAPSDSQDLPTFVRRRGRPLAVPFASPADIVTVFSESAVRLDVGFVVPARGDYEILEIDVLRHTLRVVTTFHDGAREDCADSSGDLTLRTTRSFDGVLVFDDDGAFALLGWTDRYAELKLDRLRSGFKLIGGLTWNGRPTELTGARTNLESPGWVSDTAAEPPAPDRADLIGFVRRGSGEQESGVSIVFQYYPAPNRFGHRRATANEHGFYRARDLPCAEAVDIVLMDREAKDDELMTAYVPVRERVVLPGGGVVPKDVVLADGVLLVELGDSASGSLELREADTPRESPALLSRAVDGSFRRLMIRNVPSGRYTLEHTTRDSLVIGRADVEVADSDLVRVTLDPWP